MKLKPTDYSKKLFLLNDIKMDNQNMDLSNLEQDNFKLQLKQFKFASWTAFFALLLSIDFFIYSLTQSGSILTFLQTKNVPALLILFTFVLSLIFYFKYVLPECNKITNQYNEKIVALVKRRTDPKDVNYYFENLDKEWMVDWNEEDNIYQIKIKSQIKHKPKKTK